MMAVSFIYPVPVVSTGTPLQRLFSRAGSVVSIVLCLLVVLPLCAASLSASAASPSSTPLSPANSSPPLVRMLTLQGAIGPAASDWFQRALAQAGSDNAALFVLQLDTPGGLDSSMREMIAAILAAQVPVVTWVSPKGARAASAGTYILYASHIAAMASATNLGAATPVQIGMPLSMPGQDQEKNEGAEQDQAAGHGNAMEKKLLNDAAAYIRGLALLRGRNADWAERAVREGVSLTAVQAHQEGVVDVLADDLDGLLAALAGKEVQTERGSWRLVLAGARIEKVQKDWRTAFLEVITDPSIAYLLLLAGIYGLILEFYSPGGGVAGMIGAICLMTAMYALQMLPISYVGLALILLGVGLMVAEVLSPTFGVFGLGGAVAFIIGSVMLIDTDLPGFKIALPIIAAFGVTSLLLLGLVLRMALKARSGKQVSGMEAMIGASGRAMVDMESRGHVFVMGEIWQAQSNVPVRKNDEVIVRAVNGLTLTVEAKK